MKLTPCGVNCSSCHLLEQCGSTCNDHEGKPFYIQGENIDACMIYKCAVLDKGYQTCAQCPDLPCQIYFDWRDPSVSEEDHAKGVQERVKQLKSMLEEKRCKVM
jgi:hypothetical protein